LIKNLADFQPLFERRGDDIARALGNTNATASLTVDLIKSSDTASVFNVTCGTLGGVLKLFAQTSDGAVAYTHERDASLIIKDSQLMPPFLQFSDSDSFVMTRLVDAEPVSAALSSQPLEGIAHKIGAWIARFENEVPSTPATTNWAEYLGKIDGITAFSTFSTLHDALKAIPIESFVLARNDNALTNYLVDAEGQIWGVDFESSVMKPAGWDLCMAAFALVNNQTENVNTVVSNLSKGYLTVAAPSNFVEETLETILRSLMPIILEMYAAIKGFAFK